MTRNSNEPREALTPGVREDQQSGGSDPNVAQGSDIAQQVRRRREAASRCEPLDCGHRDPLDCVAARCGEPVTTDDGPTESAPRPDGSGDITALWANAKIAWGGRDFPRYGSPEWVALTPDDPRRLAGALEAAEMWRKYGDEEALIQWLREAAQARPSIADRRTRAELDQAAKPKPPHRLRSTPGWPPIAIPGRPGRYLYARQEQAA